MDNVDGDTGPSTYCKNQMNIISCTSCAHLQLRRAFYVKKSIVFRESVEKL